MKIKRFLLSKQGVLLTNIFIILMVASIGSAVVISSLSNTVTKTTTVSGAPIQLSMTSSGVNGWNDTAYRGVNYYATLHIHANVTTNVTINCKIYGPNANNTVLLSVFENGNWAGHGMYYYPDHCETPVKSNLAISKGQTIDIQLQVSFAQDGVYSFQFYSYGV